MENNEVYGKCNYINLQNGLKCGCLRYRNIQNNDLLCEGCEHDQTFHEKDNQNLSKNTHYSPINLELNNIFKKRKLPNYTIDKLYPKKIFVKIKLIYIIFYNR